MSDGSGDQRSYVANAIFQLTTKDGMTSEKIPQELIEALGVSTHQQAYDAIQGALELMPQNTNADVANAIAIRYGLGGESFSPSPARRYAGLAERYGVTAEAIKRRAQKGAQMLAGKLLVPSTVFEPPAAVPESTIVATLQGVQRAIEEQNELLGELRDLLQK
jgi:hypothetical protein